MSGILTKLDNKLNERPRYDPDALDDVDKDIFITFAITFLSPNYVNNPFLKAKLVTVRLYFTVSCKTRLNSILDHLVRPIPHGLLAKRSSL